jgi:hypothetical protein
MRFTKAILPLLPLTLLLIIAACATPSLTEPPQLDESLQEITEDAFVEFTLVPVPNMIALNNDPEEREKASEKSSETAEQQHIILKKPSTPTEIDFPGKIAILTSPLAHLSSKNYKTPASPTVSLGVRSLQSVDF